MEKLALCVTLPPPLFLSSPAGLTPDSIHKPHTPHLTLNLYGGNPTSKQFDITFEERIWKETHMFPPCMLVDAADPSPPNSTLSSGLGSVGTYVHTDNTPQGESKGKTNLCCAEEAPSTSLNSRSPEKATTTTFLHGRRKDAQRLELDSDTVFGNVMESRVCGVQATGQNVIALGSIWTLCLFVPPHPPTV